VSKEFFEALLATFAREAEAGLSRIVLLVLDNAGWHGPANLKIPDGIRLIYLPPYTPELQPAETLWALVDEPIVNQHIATIAELDEKNRRPVYRPRRAARTNPKPNRIPLVAKSNRSELINRNWYDSPVCQRMGDQPMTTTILPPASLASMTRCASWISSKRNTRDGFALSLPDATCCAIS